MTMIYTRIVLDMSTDGHGGSIFVKEVDGLLPPYEYLIYPGSEYPAKLAKSAISQIGATVEYETTVTLEALESARGDLKIEGWSEL